MTPHLNSLDPVARSTQFEDRLTFLSKLIVLRREMFVGISSVQEGTGGYCGTGGYWRVLQNRRVLEGTAAQEDTGGYCGRGWYCGTGGYWRLLRHRRVLEGTVAQEGTAAQ
jgi:hypothetical protein